MEKSFTLPESPFKECKTVIQSETKYINFMMVTVSLGNSSYSAL